MLTHVWTLQWFLIVGSCCALKCWHCIADNCDLDPDDNYKAEQRSCQEGQYCQKVYFEMHSTFYDKQFFSTVRGCAWDCVPKDDFRNCSRDLYASRGCIQKSCCNDNDLCNDSQSNHGRDFSIIFAVLTTIISNYMTNYIQPKAFIYFLCLYFLYIKFYTFVTYRLFLTSMR